MDECPSRAWISFGCAPAATRRESQVCRRSWKRRLCFSAGSAGLRRFVSSSRSNSSSQQRKEARERAKREQTERVEREHKEVEERAERKHQEVENATLSQQNALKSAEQYLETSAFSEAGLIEQLSSEAGSKYPHADAVWAVEHLEVNWNEQAVKSARQYLSTSSFSCQGLIEQLSSEAGSKFTVAQAEYAANKVGLC
jgi:hypothetical protein